MEKKSLSKEVKRMDVQCIIAGVSILFSALTAVLGYEKLSIGNAMIFAIFCVMSCMAQDLKDLCNSLVEEEEKEI